MHDKIEARAYGLFVERNGTNGSQLDDWLRAEKEVEKEDAQMVGPKPLLKADLKTVDRRPVLTGK